MDGEKASDIKQKLFSCINTAFEGLNLYMVVVELKLTNGVNSNSRDIWKLSAEFTRVLRQVDKFDQHVNYLTDVEAESDCNSADIIFNLIKGNKERSESVKTLKLEVENYTK